MHVYIEARFNGRKNGAIGITCPVCLSLEFDHEPTEDEIRARIYETHDHVCCLWWDLDVRRHQLDARGKP